jgi:hypothetical protein
MWVNDCCLMPNEQFFSHIMVRTSYILMMMMSALFLTNALSWIFIVQTHWNNSPQVEMLFHSDTLFWFRTNLSFLLLMYNEKATNTNFIVWYDTTRARTKIFHSRGKHANHYATTVFVCTVMCSQWPKIFTGISCTANQLYFDTTPKNK